jgi:DNA-binding LacI/PurR family transcriptional regulator
MSTTRSRARGRAQPTIRDVARAAGVSKSTVSNVVRDVEGVAPATRERVQAAIAAVGYRPNALARDLVRRRTTTVGIVVGDLANPFYSELAKLAEQRLSAVGLATMICNTDGHPESERARIEMLLEHRVAGILMLQFSGERTILIDLRAQGVAVVIVSLWEEEADCVSIDERAGVALAVSHLLGLGHRRVGYLSSDLVEPQTDSVRFDGYAHALDRFGLEPDPELFLRLEHPAYLRSDDSLRTSIRRVLALDDPPTAFFGSNDLVAIDLLETMEELGVDVPADVSVAGFDDILVAGLARVSLTTVAQPREDLARIGIELLLERIEGGPDPALRQRLLPPTLVVRGSTAPAPLRGSGDVADRLPGA